MAYLQHIVHFINEQLNQNLLQEDCFASKQVVDLAQILPRRDGDQVELLPCYVDDDGEARHVGPDDEFDVSLYHRVNGILMAKGPVGFGDESPIESRARMNLVVFGRRDKLHLTNDELAILIQASFPDVLAKDRLKELGFLKCVITINDIILNDLQVFSEEYQGIEFFLKPEQYLFKINYTIESAFLKKCLKRCVTC